MSYLQSIRAHRDDPEQLELLYRQALAAGETHRFVEALQSTYTEQPDHLLYAAWHYRFAYAVADKAKSWAIAWGWAIPLAVINGLLFWWLSDDQVFMIRLPDYSGAGVYDFLPLLILIWAPISAFFAMLYLAVAGQRRWPRVLGIGVGLAALFAYVLLLYPQTGPRVFQEQYLTLMAFHLPLMAWTGVGLYLLIGQRDAENRFAFLIKSLEVFIMAGLFAIAGGIFVSITFGLFAALNVDLSELVKRLLVAGGGGLIPVLAVAIIYNPQATPSQHSFADGLSKLIAMLMRLLLPLSLLVLGVYSIFILFNFREPFENRDVLIIYNAMLFAVMALLVGATPVRTAGLSERQQTWLRRAIIAMATLAFLVSLYALAAIVYRTWIDRLTPNRLTFIGWNVVNAGILALLLVRQITRGDRPWLERLHSAFATGAVLYGVWAALIILLTPWLFGIDQQQVEALPVSVQRVVYNTVPPILLKCGGSPHVYLLEKGEKRWIKDIPTFKSAGYQWRQVQRIPCADLRAIPDGMPIPPDAGEPSQP